MTKEIEKTPPTIAPELTVEQLREKNKLLYSSIERFDSSIADQEKKRGAAKKELSANIRKIERLLLAAGE